ncbi:MAG: hypothetical protein ACYCSP_05930 [Acidobacteriaceae bacterium]
MLPQSPVVEGLEPYELILGAGQPEYRPLPVLRSPAPVYAVMSRWAPSEEERKLIAEGADIFLTVWTFGAAYPPTLLEVMRSSADPDLIRERMALDQELDERLRAIYATQPTSAPTGEENVEHNAD